MMDEAFSLGSLLAIPKVSPCQAAKIVMVEEAVLIRTILRKPDGFNWAIAALGGGQVPHELDNHADQSQGALGDQIVE